MAGFIFHLLQTKVISFTGILKEWECYTLQWTARYADTPRVICWEHSRLSVTCATNACTPRGSFPMEAYGDRSALTSVSCITEVFPGIYCAHGCHHPGGIHIGNQRLSQPAGSFALLSHNCSASHFSISILIDSLNPVGIRGFGSKGWNSVCRFIRMPLYMAVSPHRIRARDSKFICNNHADVVLLWNILKLLILIDKNIIKIWMFGEQ